MCSGSKIGFCLSFPFGMWCLSAVSMVCVSILLAVWMSVMSFASVSISSM